jgi:hypothetical protein
MTKIFIKAFLFAGILSFQINASAQVTETDPEPFYVKGRIYDILSFQPIPSVELSITNEMGEVVILKSSDENGNYKLIDLDKGNYKISLKKGSEYEITTQNVFVDNENNILMNFYLRKSSDYDQGMLIVPDPSNSIDASFKD